MEDLKNIFNEIRSYDLNISADVAIQCATRIFNNPSYSYSSNGQKQSGNNVKWRDDPITEGQTKLLNTMKSKIVELGIDIKAIDTKGKANDIIKQLNSLDKK